MGVTIQAAAVSIGTCHQSRDRSAIGSGYYLITRNRAANRRYGDLRPRMINHHFVPAHFSANNMHKDLTGALKLGEKYASRCRS